ncbi:MAG: hypothetical protein MMC33_002270 [Icmadophila ericetorum]|nr:hypothetical protein [Icmadophila ericetorum]
MENTLTHLIDSLRSSLKLLKGKSHSELLATLHDHDKLPDKHVANLAHEAINLLHETEQLLEPGPLVLADHFLGFLNCKCLCAAVEFNIPDILRDGPKTLEEIAIASNARPDRLQQVMRVLYNDSIFSYNTATDSYSNNTTSQLLLSDHWTQWRNWVDLYGNEFYNMARGIPASCRKDATRMAGQINYDTDTDLFAYFTEQGWLPRLHRTLGGGAAAQAPGILEDYPWEEIADTTFLDVGGGGGALVALILRKHKGMQAGILDLPAVIKHATGNFHDKDGQFVDVGDRVPTSRLISGDFLVEIPSYEVYTMKWCLHDWDDSKALKVMGNIRKTITRGPRSRLIILESLLEDGRMGRLSRYADMTMAISASGQERNEAEWKALAEKTGWKINHIYYLRNAWPCAIELLPVWESENSGDTGVKTTANGRANINGHSIGSDVPSSPDPVLSNSATTNGHKESPETLQSNGLLHGEEKKLGEGQVSSVMSFLEPWDPSRGNPFYRSAADEGFENTNFKWVDQTVTITNARPQKGAFMLDKNGFAYHDDEELAPELIDALRKGEKETVKNLYYPKVEEFIKKHTGASRVIIFDHTLRKRDPGRDAKDNPNGKEQPATVVHCDQSPKGAIARVKQNIGPEEDVDTILRGRAQIINVWRPLRGPIVDWPLAQMDFQSLAPPNFYPCNLWKHQFEERGQVMTFTHTETQKWYYLDKHRTNEVTMIKIWDSKGGVANMCPHAAFKHPDTPADAPPRESVEVRCIVLYGNEEKSVVENATADVKNDDE